MIGPTGRCADRPAHHVGSNGEAGPDGEHPARDTRQGRTGSAGRVRTWAEHSPHYCVAVRGPADFRHEEQPAAEPGGGPEGMADAVALAKRSDVAVLVLGEIDLMSAESASRSSLKLSNGQEELLEAVAATGKPVVLVLVNGRPLDISWARGMCRRFWKPGIRAARAATESQTCCSETPILGALAGELASQHGPAADLLQPQPDAAARDVARLQVAVLGHSQVRRYTRSVMGSATRRSRSTTEGGTAVAKVGATIDVSADVTNTGSRAGDTVVQLYIHQRAGSASRPVRQLKGFERVSLAPGAKQTLHFKLTTR